MVKLNKLIIILPLIFIGCANLNTENQSPELIADGSQMAEINNKSVQQLLDSISLINNKLNADKIEQVNKLIDKLSLLDFSSQKNAENIYEGAGWIALTFIIIGTGLIIVIIKFIKRSKALFVVTHAIKQMDGKTSLTPHDIKNEIKNSPDYKDVRKHLDNFVKSKNTKL